MRMAWAGLGLTLLLSLALLALGAQAQAVTSAPHSFPVIDTVQYPSADQGSPPGFPAHSALMTASTGTAGQAVFLPVLGAIGVDMTAQSWFSSTLSGATQRMPADAVATLQFAPVNVEALASFTVSLHAVDAQGHDKVLGSSQRTFNLPRIVSSDEVFQLPTTGQIVPRGDAMRLTVRADAVDVLTTLQYGGGTHTAVKASFQVLDTDGDGIPDDADPCPLQVDCNGNGVIDGDQAANATSGQTVYQAYRQWYNTTNGAGAPGAPNAPGAPGAPGSPALPPAFPGTGAGGAGNGPTGPGLPASKASVAQLGRIETAAGGLALASGSTITTLSLLRRRP